MLFWIIGAVVILGALVVYAYLLHVKVGQKQAQQTEWQTELEGFVDERRENIMNSISIIANAMLQGEMSVAECCLRLSNLLKKIGDVADQERFVVIHKVATNVEHVPILEEWQSLKFKQRMVYMKEIEALETQYRDFVLDSCKSIQSQGVNGVSVSGVASIGVDQP